MMRTLGPADKGFLALIGNKLMAAAKNVELKNEISHKSQLQRDKTVTL